MYNTQRGYHSEEWTSVEERQAHKTVLIFTTPNMPWDRGAGTALEHVHVDTKPAFTQIWTVMID